MKATSAMILTGSLAAPFLLQQHFDDPRNTPHRLGETESDLANERAKAADLARSISKATALTAMMSGFYWLLTRSPTAGLLALGTAGSTALIMARDKQVF